MDRSQEVTQDVGPEAAQGAAAGQQDYMAATVEAGIATAGIASDERRRMIAEAAYFRYQARAGGSGDEFGDWAAAEAEVDRQLMEGGLLSGGTDEPERVSFNRRMEAQLERWDGALEKLRAQAHEKGSSLVGQLAKLEDMRHQMRDRLESMSGHTGAAWKDLKVGVEAAWEDMRGAIDRMSSRFK